MSFKTLPWGLMRSSLSIRQPYRQGFPKEIRKKAEEGKKPEQNQQNNRIKTAYRISKSSKKIENNRGNQKPANFAPWYGFMYGNIAEKTVNPRTKVILAILEPVTFEIAISGALFEALRRSLKAPAGLFRMIQVLVLSTFRKDRACAQNLPKNSQKIPHRHIRTKCQAQEISVDESYQIFPHLQNLAFI
jgi:hypothetical protein